MTEYLDGNDVVSMEANWSLLNTPTFKVSQFTRGFSDRFGSSTVVNWLGEGVECEVLKAGAEWRKGRIRIRFEFVPDTPDEPGASNETTSQPGLITDG
jgi:hypothetical protein